MGKSKNLADLLSASGLIGAEDFDAGAVVSNNYTTSAYVSNTSFEALKSNSLGRRNIIINGAMRVAQRGTSQTGITTTGYHTVDRVRTTYGNLGTWTQTQESDAPDGFDKSLKMECTTAAASPAAGGYLLIAQMFEGQDLQHLKKGTSSAEPVTASFWVKSNKTGTYIAELLDQDNSARHIGKSFTVNSSGTWEYKTVTFEGDTTGVLVADNSTSIDFSIWLGAGSTYNSGTLQTSWGALSQTNRAVGNVNLADTIGNYFQITGVQLEVGETATPFEHRSYGEELALCQRYYQITYNTQYSTGNFGGQVETYPVQMRVSPSVELVGTAGLTSQQPTNYGANGPTHYYYYHTSLGYCSAKLTHDADL